MDLPNSVTSSGLYLRLKPDTELSAAIGALRSVAASLAETTGRTVPDFTDHTVRHMDALWSVTDRVLTPSEIQSLTDGEAFLLACGYYLHDIGMAYAATADGLKAVRESPVYQAILAAGRLNPATSAQVEARAVAAAVRAIHANAALQLATSPVPGTSGIYLFESRSIREAWGATCAEVASSHHWDLEKLDRQLGTRGPVPLPGGRKGDLAYVASVLRLVDYAHMNRDRASSLDRAFRPKLDPESLTHWLAQEHIDGPERVSNELVYRSATQIADVDAWWLYYQMLTGLDSEIRGVRRLLERRVDSQNRLSLQGVRGVSSPEELARYIQTSGFLPIEVNLRAGSIDRLVELLAGESLYGPEPLVAVRELLQNARDAVRLKTAIAETDLDKAALTIPIRVSLKTSSGDSTLEIIDSGVGMTRRIMTEHLISIASDYWNTLFLTEFPSANARGFKPAGKFGIGFLSVFMLGDEAVVESNRSGATRYQLRLRGVGRRGEIREVPSPSGSGTAVRIRLKGTVIDALRPLAEVIKVYAPAFPHDLEISVDGGTTKLPVGWIGALKAPEFVKWVLSAVDLLRRVRGPDFRRDGTEPEWMLSTQFYHAMLYGRRRERIDDWPTSWPEYADGSSRLAASFEGVSLLCLRGLTVQSVLTPGFVGVIDVDTALTDVSRSRMLNSNLPPIVDRARKAVVLQVVSNLNALSDTALIVDKQEFLAGCVAAYGRETLVQSSVRWISSLKMPGEVELVSSATFLSRARQCSSVFFVYNSGPWTAMRYWVASPDVDRASELAVVLDGKDYPSPRYVTGDERTGRLLELWDRCVDVPLFGTLLRILGEAWQINPNDLAKQDGWRQRGDVIWGRIRRP